MNFSLRTLLIFTAGVAVVSASLVYPSSIVGDLYYTFGLLAIAFAAIAALYRRGLQRAFWVGFLVLFASYYGHSVWPSELRGTWAVMQRFGGLDYPTQGLLPTRLLTLLYEGLHGDFRPQSAVQFGSRTARGNELVGRFIAFQTVGHTAIAVLLGLGGGALARRWASQLSKPFAPNSEEDLP